MFNITYYPIFSKFKNILSIIHLLLTPDREHSKVFENILIRGFKKAKNLNGILVRSKVPPLKTEEGFCDPWNKPRYEIYKHITKTHQFQSSSTSCIYSIRPNNLNRASKNVVYLFLLVKPTLNKIQEALKNFGVDSIITDICIGTLWGTKRLSKSHFTPILLKVFSKEKMIGKLN